MTRRVVVHAGGVHMDEILAVGMICEREGVLTVERRNPTAAELADPEVWVVDVGARHEPELRNFDHHQDDPTVAADCAFSLVARHLDLQELLRTRPWYGAQIRVDNEGPHRLARDQGWPVEALAWMTSPLDVALLRLWGAGGAGRVAEETVAMVTHLVGTALEEARAFGEELARVEPLTRVHRLGGVAVVLHETIVSDAVSEHLRERLQDADGEIIAASVSLDDREPFGWALYRFEDDPRVDLTRVRDDPRIAFAHKRGFIAKTREQLPLEQVWALMAAALVPPPRRTPGSRS